MESTSKFKRVLRDNGYSITSARLKIFKVLQDSEPQTMHEIVSRLNGQIDRASAYRTIALLEALGIVERLQIGWKYKIELSDSFHDHHHHLTCSDCGLTIPLPADEELEDRLTLLAQQSGFSAQSHQIEIRGWCAQCLPKHA